MTSEPLRLPEQIDSLDGVRGLASLLVIFFHGFYGTMMPFFEAPQNWTGFGLKLLKMTEPLSGGVDIFFVLSGFLITRTLFASMPLAGPRGRGRILHFYMRRLARLYPLYLVLILALALMGQSYQFVLLAVFFLANSADLFHSPTLWLPIWSIAIEIHFYFLWPLILKLGGKKTIAVLSLSILLFSPALRALGFENAWNIYSHTWFRLDGLATGSLLAWLVFEIGKPARFFKILSYAALAIFAVSVIFKPEFLIREDLYGQIFASTLWQCLGVALICGAITGAWGFDWLRRGFFVKMGLYSYGFFLIHPVLFDIGRRLESAVMIPAEGEGLGIIFLRFGVIFVLSYILAAASFLFFEKPTYLAIVKYFRTKWPLEPKEVS